MREVFRIHRKFSLIKFRISPNLPSSDVTNNNKKPEIWHENSKNVFTKKCLKIMLQIYKWYNFNLTASILIWQTVKFFSNCWKSDQIQPGWHQNWRSVPGPWMRPSPWQSTILRTCQVQTYCISFQIRLTHDKLFGIVVRTVMIWITIMCQFVQLYLSTSSKYERILLLARCILVMRIHIFKYDVFWFGVFGVL